MGITRAEKDLTLTCARKRMVHGETQYKKMSRFLKEIPLELLETGPSSKKREERRKRTGKGEDLFHAGERNISRRKHLPHRSRYSSSVHRRAGSFLTESGDRVRHIKFGEGTVTAIIEGGRDYEVTVHFDGPGTKKMFASICQTSESITIRNLSGIQEKNLKNK